MARALLQVLVPIGCVLYLHGSCVSPSRRSLPMVSAYTVSDVLHVVRLGMSRDELRSGINSYEEAGRTLFNPGTLRLAARVVIADDLCVTVAFDDADRVCGIWTMDSRVRVQHGHGVGTKYGTILAHQPAPWLVRWPGYGVLLDAGGDTWLCFDWADDPLTNDSTVRWIEIRADIP